MNTNEYHFRLAAMKAIRETQMDKEIIPFYEAAGLNINLKGEIRSIDNVEQYTIYKQSTKLDGIFYTPPDFCLYFVEMDVYEISSLSVSDEFIAPMYVHNKKTIHIIPTEMIKIQFFTKTDYFISPDARVNILKSAIPHIILSGD